MTRRRSHDGSSVDPSRSVRMTVAAGRADRAEPMPARHPAAIATALFAAACIVFTVTYPLNEPDFWQHLLVGRAIWKLHTVPLTQIWTWPTYGAPAITPSWGFRALLHPFWAAAGVWGLFAWRWLTTLGAFAIVVAAARRMGARGLVTWLAVVIGALAWRGRSQVRPESIIAVIMALEIWILETRRRGGPDRSLWLIPLAWVWINCHISYHLGLAILAAYVVDAWAARHAQPRGGESSPLRLVFVGVGMLAVSFLNPYGVRAVWSPFEFVLRESHEPIYRTIGELEPIRWSENLWNGAPLLVFGWPLLLAMRARRRGIDWAETLLAALFVTLAVTAVRFLGFLAIVGTPFVARDLSELVERVPAPPVLRAPWGRAALACAACLAIGMPEWSRVDRGMGIVWRVVPVRACDFMAAHGIRGRGYNTFSLGGYVLWRFWPEHDRLPFMDIHQSGTTEDRRLYTFSLERPQYWQTLDTKYHFDWVLLARRTFAADRLPDFLDADSTWALVFQDDAAMLFVRRVGGMAGIAEQYAYRVAPAGNARLARLAPALGRSPAMRAAFRADLERTTRESPYTSQAHGLLANLDLLEGNREGARDHLRQALAEDPDNEEFRAGLKRLAPGGP